MKVKCVKCKHKFNVEVDNNGVPKTYVCPDCRERKTKNE